MVDASYPRFQRAVARHLSPLEGLRGVHGFVRREGAWIDAARLGRVAPDLVEGMLSRFDPEAGGAVEALSAGQGEGWLATYMLGGPGLDLALIFFLDPMPPADLQSRLDAIETRVGWLMVAALREHSEIAEETALGTEIGVTVLLEAARAGNRRTLAEQWIARLEKVLSPDMVAVCWIREDKPKLVAISGGKVVDRKSEPRSRIEAMARRAVELRAPVLAEVETGPPDPEGEQAEPAEQEAADQFRRQIDGLGGAQGMALPIYRGDRAEAAVVAIYNAGSTASMPRPEGTELIAEVLGESLAIQRRAHPSMAKRAGNWIAGGARAIFGRTAWKLKLLALVAIVALAALAVTPASVEPSFSARVEAADRRTVAAPFDGFLASAPHQLGDMIAEGNEVLALEDADLRLELARAEAELAGVEAELQTARAERDTARVRALDAERRQAEIRADLLRRQLDLARRVAAQPLLVIGGDAWRRVGGRVRLGEPLLELADPSSFRVLAFIDEDWVADIPGEARGTLLLTAFPERPIGVRLSDITAAPETRDGVNTFATWMEIEGDPGVDLLDGMRGVVRIEVPPRSMLEAYSRGPRRWIERTLWRWFP